MRVILSLILFVAFWSPPDWAFCDYYKCKDKNGHFHFSDDSSKLPAGCLERATLETTNSPSEAQDLTKQDKIEKWRKLLPGIWEAKGMDNNEPYTTIWEIKEDGRFSGEATGQLGEGAFGFRFSGEWQISDDNKLISTYTWSSIPVPKPGTKDIDEIVELNDSHLLLKSGKTGLIDNYIRKR